MAKIKVYNLDGEAKEDLELKDSVFNVALNENLLHQVIVSTLSNKRGVYAHTKTRAHVRGGGRKPWRQKGTGRARHGSIRSPLWIGGGVTFGPTNERNFKVKINKKVRQRAMAMVLSDKLENKKIIAVDKMDIKEPKTNALSKTITKLLKAIVKEPKGKVLLASEKNDNLKIASRNLQNIEYKSGNDLNVLDVVNNSYLIIEKNELQKIEKRLK